MLSDVDSRTTYDGLTELRRRSSFWIASLIGGAELARSAVMDMVIDLQQEIDEWP